MTIKSVDVVGGFDTLEAYTQDTSNQGAIVGRVANRIENACCLRHKIYLLQNHKRRAAPRVVKQLGKFNYSISSRLPSGKVTCFFGSVNFKTPFSYFALI